MTAIRPLSDLKVTTFPPVPADPLKADERSLTHHGFPRRPTDCPELLLLWERAVKRISPYVRPTFRNVSDERPRLRVREGSSKAGPMRLFDWLKPCNRGFLRSVLGVSLALAALGDAGTAHAGVVITPTFDTSITSDPNAAAIETAINTSIGIYESLFTDPINVGILFRYATTFADGTPLNPGILGNNFHTLWSFSYNTYINALKADGTTANDATALGNLPAASAFPNSPRNLQFSSANGRAVGLNTPPLSTVNGVPGVFDGVVTLNSGQPFQFDRTGGIAPTNFDAMRVIEHEIDEVLGLGSTLPDGKDFAGAPAVSPEDLFRYSAPGTISFTNSGSALSYFSIDGGVTNIVGFNQDNTGDYGDWLGSSTVALVQAAFIGHHQADISATSPEGIALDVIGYDLVPVPEPSTLAIAGTLLLAGGAWRRRWNSRGRAR